MLETPKKVRHLRFIPKIDIYEKVVAVSICNFKDIMKVGVGSNSVPNMTRKLFRPGPSFLKSHFTCLLIKIFMENMFPF